MTLAVEPLAHGDEDVAEALAGVAARGASGGNGGHHRGGSKKGGDAASAAATDHADVDSGDDGTPEGVVMANVFAQAHGHLHARVLDETPAAGPSSSSGSSNAANGDEPPPLKLLPPPLADALRDAVASCLGRGPLLGYPLVGLRVRIIEEGCAVSPDSNPAAVKAAAARAFAAALAGSGVALCEPVMAVEVAVPDGPAVGDVISDLSSSKRGRIREVGHAHALAAAAALSTTAAGSTTASKSSAPNSHSKVLVRGWVPLREMVGYSTSLRSRTAGEGAFAMEFSHYAPVGPSLQRALVDDPLSRM